MSRRFAIQPKDEKKFLDDYAELRTAAAVADKWCITLKTALNTLRRLGASINKPGRHIGQGCDTGPYHPKLGVWRDAHVAKDMGVSRQAVTEARKRRGIESPVDRAFRLLEEQGQ